MFPPAVLFFWGLSKFWFRYTIAIIILFSGISNDPHQPNFWCTVHSTKVWRENKLAWYDFETQRPRLVRIFVGFLDCIRRFRSFCHNDLWKWSNFSLSATPFGLQSTTRMSRGTFNESLDVYQKIRVYFGSLLLSGLFGVILFVNPWNIMLKISSW